MNMRILQSTSLKKIFKYLASSASCNSQLGMTVKVVVIFEQFYIVPNRLTDNMSNSATLRLTFIPSQISTELTVS